jgi:membrane protein YqaA with SNARE-associated domain
MEKMSEIAMVEVWIAALIAVVAFGLGCAYGYCVDYIGKREKERKKVLIHEAIDEYLSRKEQKH